MDNTNLDHGSLFDPGLGDIIDAIRYAFQGIDELGIPQKVVLNGKVIEVRVEVK
jgi:hypothetical protein